MNQDDYITKRVDNQIAWYDRKSQNNQRAFKALRILEITAAASIPLLAGYSDYIDSIKLYIGLLGLFVAIVAGLLGLYQFQENWTEYRITCESLKHEKFLFLTKTEPYNVDEPFSLFVQRVESLISKEHSNWAQYMRACRKEKNHG